MTIKTIDVIYEGGMFRLPTPLGLNLEEGQRVRITVEIEEAPLDPLSLLGEVYRGLSADEIDEIEAISHDRTQFFAASDPLDAGREK